MFQGASALTLDAKGRITVPARHRDVLLATAGGQLTITKHPKGTYLLVYPRPYWEELRKRLADLPEEAAWWRRILISRAMDVEIDGSSRVLLSPELRVAAALNREVMLLGLGHYFELWDRATLEQAESEVAAAPMPEAIKGFTL